jgi:prepilin-type N-terminal cleavage/methylation domain-containing protein
MMTRTRFPLPALRPRRRRQGFTLVEIIIVGVLISLFSSLAVIAVQQQFESNKRKATIGEARQIATALEFANLDTGIFPKLCFLTESRQGLEFLSNELFPAVNPSIRFLALFGSLDIYSRQTPNTNEALAGRVYNQWNGPYFALASGRRGFAQGRGGYSYMLLPDLPVAGPNTPTGGLGLRWPTDPNNNPYMVYMLDLENSVNGVPRLQFVEGATVGGDVSRKGNYVNAIVSHGRNQYPGGEPVPDDDNPSNRNAMLNLRLYEEVPGATKGVPTFRLRVRTEYTTQRANIWTARFAQANGVPLPIRPGGITSTVGIADPTSDDIVFEF